MFGAFSQSFKHFKDNFFKVFVMELGCSLFYNEDESSYSSGQIILVHYKGMKKEEVFVHDK